MMRRNLVHQFSYPLQEYKQEQERTKGNRYLYTNLTQNPTQAPSYPSHAAVQSRVSYAMHRPNPYTEKIKMHPAIFP